MNYLRSVELFVLACIPLSVVPNVYASDCAGDTRREHHVQNFNFITSSWVEVEGNRRRYVSCVANLDKGSDLLITWFIPGPYDEYVPDDEVALTPRPRDDINPRPVDGCLKYGSLGEMRTAEFMGTADDENKNGADLTCGQKPNNLAEPKIIPEGLPPDGWTDNVRVFFPSDLSNPRNSMLEVTGTIGIRVDGGTYTSYFDYSVGRYKDRPDGVIDNVTIEPFFPVQSKQFLAAFAEKNPDFATRLSEKGSLSFRVLGFAEHKWRVVDAYYRFLDKDNRTLAAIPMPLFEDAGE